MQRKIIFLDIDGTLTPPGSNTPPDSALQAIGRARKNGHLVFLCTGRNYQMAKPLLAYGFDGVVASAGGYIRAGDTVIYDCPMTDAQRIAAMDVLRENGIYRTVECLDGSYTDEGFKEFLQAHAGNGANSELLRWRRQIESALGIRPMHEYGGQPVYKIVIMLTNEAQLAAPQRLLKAEFCFCMQARDAYGMLNGEIINRNFDKGKGVARVCAYLGMRTEDSIAFGDSANDREMLAESGMSICMENGSEAAKRCADLICPSVENDGIFRAFTTCALI